jgi:hypothetical protein
MGSGGPSTSNFFRRTTSCAKGSPKRMGPFMVTGHVVDQLRLPGHAVPDQGGELFDHLGLLDLGALHRQRRRTDPDGQAGHRLRRRRRGAGLDAVVPVRRDGRDVVEIQRHARDREPRLRRHPRRLRHRRRRRRGGAGGTGARQGARREDLCRTDRLRRHLGRLRHGRALGRGRRAVDAAGGLATLPDRRSTTSTPTAPRPRPAT